MGSYPAAWAEPTAATANTASTESRILILLDPPGLNKAALGVGRLDTIKIPTRCTKPMAESRIAVHMTGMSEIHAVAVYCGSRHGNSPAYRAAAQALGHG